MQILSGVFEGRDHRHADRAADRERRPALQGLWRDQRPVPARPCRLHLSGQIRRARLSRRRPVSRRARPRRASRPAPSRARCSGTTASRSAARWCRSGRTRSTARSWDWDADRATIPSGARTARRRSAGKAISTSVRKAGSSVGAVIEVVADGVPAGLGAPIYGKLDADLAARADEHQRGQGRGDRRRLRRRRAVRRGERRRDAHGRTARSRFLSNHAGGILGGISTGQAIVARFAVKPTSSILTPRADRRPSRQRDRDRHQGPPRSLRRHPRRAGGRGDDGLRAGRPPAAPPRAVRLRQG